MRMVVQMKVDGSNNESGRSSLCSRDRPFSIFGAFISLIVRLNSEDFSNFLWCLDIIFSTYYYERTHKNVQKNHEFFRIFWNFREFFPFFRGFLFSVFLRSNAQSRDSHQTIPLEFLRRMYIVRSLKATEGKWFYTKNRPKM